MLCALAGHGCGGGDKSPDDMMAGPTPGSLLWARAAGGSDADQGDAIAATSDGFAVTGAFGGEATFGAGGGAETLSAADIEDAFVARYDATGELLWVRAGGGPGADHGESMMLDANGDTFATGSFSSEAIFGAGEAGQTTLTSVGSRDLFLARYDADGAVRWAKSAGSFYGHDVGEGLALPGEGSVLLCGSFTNAALFDQAGPNPTMLLGPGLSDIFVASYTGDGALSWVTPAGGTGEDTARALATSPAGGVFIAGRFEGTATFGEAPAQQTLTSAGDGDLFLARYAADGALVWAKRAGGAGSDEAVWIGLSADQVLVAGSFSQTAEFGDADPVAVDSAGAQDTFLASYDADGALSWVVTAGGPEDDTAQGAALAGDGAAVTGGFGDGAVFGRGEAAETTLESSGGDSDLFVAVFDGDGSLRWARAAGGSAVDAGLGVAVLDDAIVVTGRFGATATFGAGEPGEAMLGSSGASDVFFAAFAP